MPERTWHIDVMHWGGGDHPTHITIKLDDPALYPAIEQFAEDEALKVIPSEIEQRNEHWIAYPREDFEQAKKRLEQSITNLYWENRWTSESQFKVNDQVEIIETLRFAPGQQPIFVQMYDEGIITEIVGFDLYTVAFKNSGTFSSVHAHHLRLL